VFETFPIEKFFGHQISVGIWPFGHQISVQMVTKSACKWSPNQRGKLFFPQLGCEKPFLLQ
jgi:hypothetical protein